MVASSTKNEIEAALDAARRFLLEARSPAGHWRGELSSSALSTATATFALDLAAREGPAARRDDLVRGGLEWLARNVNPDGGWGDTVRSASNLSTTCLAWAALRGAGSGERASARAIQGAEAWVAARTGSLEPAAIAEAVAASYGADRTFSAPILSMCALAGCLGDDRSAWRLVPVLPFELAALPRAWFSRLGLRVVSYALPALVAVGLLRHRRLPALNPVARGARGLARRRALRLLEAIQPASGGFLEATPLTSFVAMSLCGAGHADHPVTARCLEFLARSTRPDGSWPIDTDLATWVTTLSINALNTPEGVDLPDGEKAPLREWLLGQQCGDVHPYTGAAAGGWAWTDLPGGVPDADDTAGAVLALRHLGGIDDRTHRAALAGLGWLAGLQNRDGGMPTFCRGWGRLPFDRSSPDLTAHALRALAAWHHGLPPKLRRVGNRCVFYLLRTQAADGSWVPLWFGNEHAPGLENPLYGTARVLAALRGTRPGERGVLQVMKRRGLAWLLGARGADGGWGGVRGAPPTIEETALAVDALADPPTLSDSAEAREAFESGAVWLARRVAAGGLEEAAPIGFYFARLWYFERLYPAIFATGALGRALRHL